MAEMKKYGYKAPESLMERVAGKAAHEYETVTAVIIRALKDYVKDWPDSGTENPPAREVERVG